MLENTLNSRIADTCRKIGFRWRRFEVPAYCGYPDAWLGAPAGDPRFAWIESKVIATAGTYPEYRAGQLSWAAEADSYGERCITIAGCDDGFYRLWRTADVATAKAFARVVLPSPFLTTSDLPTALRKALGEP